MTIPRNCRTIVKFRLCRSSFVPYYLGCPFCLPYSSYSPAERTERELTTYSTIDGSESNL